MTVYRSKIVPFSNPFQISAAYPQNAHLLKAAQEMVNIIIPKTLWEDFDRLFEHLPLITRTPLDNGSVTITYLTAKGAQTLDIPGHTISTFSLDFQFTHDKSRFFTITQQTTLSHHADDIKQLHSTNHPIFLPRNEEDMIRNLIVLAGQIKYVRDLPQVSIHYDRQISNHVIFTVIIAHLVIFEPLQIILEKSRLKMDIDDIRWMGHLKQKYAKEGAILRITLDKQALFRADGALDLLKGRRKIVAELRRCFGEFRDFNGGMILKQEEALGELKESLGPQALRKELTLENYFYSLKPSVMQTVHEPGLLRAHFEQLMQVFQGEIFVHTSLGKHLLVFIRTISPEEIILKVALLGISPHDLTTSIVQEGNTTAIGFIVRVESTEMVEQFLHFFSSHS